MFTNLFNTECCLNSKAKKKKKKKKIITIYLTMRRKSVIADNAQTALCLNIKIGKSGL